MASSETKQQRKYLAPALEAKKSRQKTTTILLIELIVVVILFIVYTQLVARGIIVPSIMAWLTAIVAAGVIGMTTMKISKYNREIYNHLNAGRLTKQDLIDYESRQ